MRNSKSKSFTVLLAAALLLLTVSAFSKSYIPVITKDSEAAVVEGCHEQVNYSVLKKLVHNVFENSHDEDCCETVCFCCNTNIRGSLKFALIKSGLIHISLKTKFFKNPGKLRLNKDVTGAFNNKSPPFLLY